MMKLPTRQTIDAALSRLAVIPAILFIVLPVLAVRAAFVPVTPDAAHLWPTAYFGDLRSWWKAALVIGCALWMLASALGRIFLGWRPRRDFWLASVGAALLAVVVSVSGSLYPNTSLIGYTTQYEGGMVLAAYLVAVWYIAEMIDTEKKRTLLARAILPVCLINACHGIAEAVGANPWRTGIGKWLMGVGSNDVTFRFLDTRMAYGTVFQPNHYGMLMAVLGAFALGMVGEESTVRWKALWGAGYACSLGAVFCSNSRAGILTFLFVSGLYISAVAFRKFKTGGGLRGMFYGSRFRWLLPGGVFVIVVLLFGVLLPGEVVGRFLGRIRHLSPSVAEYEITSVDLANNRIGITLPDTKVFLEKRASRSWDIVEGESGERITSEGVAGGKGWLRISIPGVTGGEMWFRPQGNAVLIAPGVDMKFYTINSGIWAVDLNSTRLLAAMPASRYRVNGWEGFFNKRGYIWRRALEGVGRAPWFGSGPGTFAQVFPNQDLLNKGRFADDENEDKGHGVWATFLVQLGVMGTLLYVLPFVVGMVFTVAGEERMRVSLLLAMAAYGICSLTNDSTVGVTPIFCVLVGLGVAGRRLHTHHPCCENAVMR